MVFDAGIGNLATSGATKRQVASLRTQFQASGERLSSATKSNSDIARAGQADSQYTVNKELQLAKGYREAASVAETKLEAAQNALQSIRELTGSVALGVQAALGEQSISGIMAQASTANGVLESVVSALNQNVAGEALFSGAKLDSAAVVSSDQFLSDVEALISGAPDSASAIAAVDFYFFDPAGGFETSSYLGSVNDGPELAISPGDKIKMDVRADGQVIREALRNMTVIAAVGNGAANSAADGKSLLALASDGQLQTNGRLINLQQSVGQQQERLTHSSAREQSRVHTLELLKNDIASVDTFSEAAKFEELRVQLETSYQVVARLSSMTLANFLR